jgi:hypothetical protein
MPGTAIGAIHWDRLAAEQEATVHAAHLREVLRRHNVQVPYVCLAVFVSDDDLFWCTGTRLCARKHRGV